MSHRPHSLTGLIASQALLIVARAATRNIPDIYLTPSLVSTTVN